MRLGSPIRHITPLAVREGYGGASSARDGGVVVEAKLAEEIVFRENRNAEFLGLFVFTRGRGHVVVDEERGGAA